MVKTPTLFIIYKVYILCGVLATLTVVSILINVIFLDNLKRSESEEQQSEDDEESSTNNPIKKFFTQLTHPYQILITPFSLWIGFIQGFMIADFTGVIYNHLYTSFKSYFNRCLL